MLRYNPDAFKIAGVTRRTQEGAPRAVICLLGELLAREPDGPFTLRREAMPGRSVAPGVGRARTHWARLGKPVLIGRARIGRASTHWASPYSLGEPSNEVGASHQTRLGRAIKRGWGEPVLIGRATQLSQPPRLLQSCACLARCLECLLGTSSACSARLVPARHTSARSARLLTSARSALCLLGTFN